MTRRSVDSEGRHDVPKHEDMVVCHLHPTMEQRHEGGHRRARHVLGFDLIWPTRPCPCPRPDPLQGHKILSLARPRSSLDGASSEPAPWRQPNGTRQQRRWAPAAAAVPSRYPLPCSPPFLPRRGSPISRTASRDRCPKWTDGTGKSYSLLWGKMLKSFVPVPDLLPRRPQGAATLTSPAHFLIAFRHFVRRRRTDRDRVATWLPEVLDRVAPAPNDGRHPTKARLASQAPHPKIC